MDLRVLVDNNTFIDQYYVGEPGLSFYLEEDGKRILFDTGYSDIFLSNAKKMNIDLSGLDYLMLSHGHDDHTGGLRYLNGLEKTTLLCHPGVFNRRYHDGKDISCPVMLDDLKVKDYLDGTGVVRISEKLYFLGQIPRVMNFEDRSLGTLEDGSPDFLYDDSALAYKGKDGLFIITACSHSGICNIIEYAKKVLMENRICGVIGGFHLLKIDEQLMKTIEYLKAADIENLYPCHCVCFKAKALMNEVCNVKEVGVGLSLHIE